MWIKRKKKESYFHQVLHSLLSQSITKNIQEYIKQASI